MTLISQPINATQRIRLPRLTGPAEGQDQSAWLRDSLRELELWTQNGQELWENHYQDLATLDTTVSGIPAEIAALEARVDQIDLDIAALEAADVVIQGDITALEGDVATLQSDVSDLQTSVGNINGTYLFPRAVRARRTASQTIADATVTTVVFTAADTFDTNSMHASSSSQVTPGATEPFDLIYVITGSCIWDNSATGERLAELRVNGSTAIASSRHQAGGDDAMSVTAIFTNFSYVELRVGQTSGGNLDVLDASLMVTGIPASAST